MAESEQNHRHAVEVRGQKLVFGIFTLGKILGFGIAVFAVACGTFLIYVDKEISGFGVLGSAVASILAAYFYTRKIEKEEDVPDVSSK